MVLTVTPNSALDRVFLIEEWTPGEPIRVEHMVPAVGGKGLDASVSLSCQEIPSLALAFFAGETGRELLALLGRYAIRLFPIWASGETRVAHVIAERKHARHTHLTAGQMTISQIQQDAFFAQLRVLLAEASWMVGGGSLPAGLDTLFFAKSIAMADRAGVPSLVDTAATPLDPITAASPPTVLKMNRLEFEAAFGEKVAGRAELLEAGRDAREKHELPNLLITDGREGLYAFSAEGILHAQAPPQAVVNAAGAGDAVSGTLAHHLSRGASWPEALRQAAAVSAATVLTETTAECRIADVQRILPAVRVRRLL